MVLREEQCPLERKPASKSLRSFAHFRANGQWHAAFQSDAPGCSPVRLVAMGRSGIAFAPESCCHQRVRAAAIVLPADAVYKDAAKDALKVRPGIQHARV